MLLFNKIVECFERLQRFKRSFFFYTAKMSKKKMERKMGKKGKTKGKEKRVK